MSRVAIIIESSNVSEEADLPGARVDQLNWENFLTSELGGSWESHEIICLSKPLSTKVIALLDKHKDKYCFVAFSGHGCDGSVALNDFNKSCPISILTPKGAKGTLIIDSCRGLEEARAINFTSAKLTYLAEASDGRGIIANSRHGMHTKFASDQTSSRSSHSFSWRLGLLQSTAGTVKMLACSAGEGADEDPDAGGYYTSLLLQSADFWQKKGGFGKIHSTKDAHDHAASKLPVQQNPEYSPPHLKFPFAVSV